MRRCIRALLVVAVTFVLFSAPNLSILAGSEQSLQPAENINNNTSLPWISQYIQQDLVTPLQVGEYASLAIRHFDDYPMVSYYDATHGDLMLAYPAQANAGNCGSQARWTCLTLDGVVDALDVGKYTSIDLWGDPAGNWKLGISYYDASDRGLRFVQWTCLGTDCERRVISVYQQAYPPYEIGLGTSLRFTSAGIPLIAFYAFDMVSTGSLMIARPVPVDGNCGYGEDLNLWSCEAIDQGALVGQYPSLDLDYNGIPIIAYYDGGNGDLKLATNTNSGNCGNNEWQCDVIDGTDGSDVGMYASLVAPRAADDPLRIAYYDKTNQDLKFYDTSGLKMIVDTMGTSVEPMGLSMALDQGGIPVIAYQQIAFDFSHPVLRLARPFQAFDDGQSGDCGEIPPGYPIRLWRCRTLDNGGAYTGEANFISVAVTSQGYINIAYTENDLSGAVSLKLIQQTLFHTFIPLTTRP